MLVIQYKLRGDGKIGPQEVHCEEGMHDKLGLKEDEKEMSKI
jgi:hypothetical protein